LRKLDAARKSVLVKMYLAGQSAPSLGRRFRVSPTTILDAVREAGHEVRRSGPPRGTKLRKRGSPTKIELDPDELRRLYVDEQHSIKEIARRLKCSELTVRARLRDYGIPLRSAQESREIAQRKRARWKDTSLLTTDARQVRLEPPGPEDKCQWQTSGVGHHTSLLEAPRCGAPTIAAGANWCQAHAVIGRDHATKKHDVLALTLAEELTVECALCGERSGTITAGDAQAWFAQHRETCANAL